RKVRPCGEGPHRLSFTQASAQTADRPTTLLACDPPFGAGQPYSSRHSCSVTTADCSERPGRAGLRSAPNAEYRADPTRGGTGQPTPGTQRSSPAYAAVARFAFWGAWPTVTVGHAPQKPSEPVLKRLPSATRLRSRRPHGSERDRSRPPGLARRKRWSRG